MFPTCSRETFCKLRIIHGSRELVDLRGIDVRKEDGAPFKVHFHFGTEYKYALSSFTVYGYSMNMQFGSDITVDTCGYNEPGVS